MTFLFISRWKSQVFGPLENFPLKRGDSASFSMQEISGPTQQGLPTRAVSFTSTFVKTLHDSAKRVAKISGVAWAKATSVNVTSAGLLRSVLEELENDCTRVKSILQTAGLVLARSVRPSARRFGNFGKSPKIASASGISPFWAWMSAFNLRLMYVIECSVDCCFAQMRRSMQHDIDNITPDMLGGQLEKQRRIQVKLGPGRFPILAPMGSHLSLATLRSPAKS